MPHLAKRHRHSTSALLAAALLLSCSTAALAQESGDKACARIGARIDQASGSLGPEIGGSKDDIFDRVHRKYRKLFEEGKFIDEEDEGPPMSKEQIDEIVSGTGPEITPTEANQFETNQKPFMPPNSGGAPEVELPTKAEPPAAAEPSEPKNDPPSNDSEEDKSKEDDDKNKNEDTPPDIDMTQAKPVFDDDRAVDCGPPEPPPPQDPCIYAICVDDRPLDEPSGPPPPKDPCIYAICVDETVSGTSEPGFALDICAYAKCVDGPKNNGSFGTIANVIAAIRKPRPSSPPLVTTLRIPVAFKANSNL